MQHILIIIKANYVSVFNIWGQVHGDKRNLTFIKCYDVSETMSGVLLTFYTSFILGGCHFSQFIFDDTVESVETCAEL